MDFVVPADHWVKKKKKEVKKIDKYLDLARKLKKPEEDEGDGGTNGSRCTWHGSQGLGKIEGGRSNLSRDENLKKYIPGRPTFTTAIRYSNDATELCKKESEKGAINFPYHKIRVGDLIRLGE